MAIKLINANISTNVLKFKPGGAPASFEVTVINESSRFASFQLEVLAAGNDSNPNSYWYSISPGVSAKKPPGDSTKFRVNITDTPVPGFVGKMNLTVRIFSLELRDEDRQVLRLVVEPGTGSVPMQVELPVREFQAHPNELVEIPVRVYNPSQLSTGVSLRFLGVEAKWLLDGVERRVQVAPGSKAETTFLCQLPVTTEAPSKAYGFTIEATQPNGPASSVEGVIKVAPGGFVDFRCIPARQQIPESKAWLPQWKTNSATYQLQFENASNLSQQIAVEIFKGEDQPRCFLDVVPVVDVNPGETKQLALVASKRRRWFGPSQRLLFEVKAIASDQRLDVRNDTQILKLRILPVLPLWLQLVGGLLLLYLAWWFSWFNPDNPLFGHDAAVTSVQFNGLGDMAISGSHDQSMIRWRVDGFTNPLRHPQDGIVAKDVNKSVRVVRYKPVDNDLVAAGLENGQIQLWDVVGNGNQPKTTFYFDKADRVLDLEFSKDSRFLFSGHGSGLVLQWDVKRALSDGISNLSKPVQGKKFNFTISALALVGQADENLVIGGRYNELVVWNLAQKNTPLRRLPYSPPGGQDDYIVSLDTAEYNSNLLVAADNKGYITLWNMEQCLIKNTKCEVLDQWSDGHGGKAVRSVALSSNGCYLASGGDDKRVMLWQLTKEGKRAFPKGKEVRSSSQRFNSVDVKVVEGDILVLSGNDKKQVRLNRWSQRSVSGNQERSQCNE